MGRHVMRLEDWNVYPMVWKKRSNVSESVDMRA